MTEKRKVGVKVLLRDIYKRNLAYIGKDGTLNT